MDIEYRYFAKVWGAGGQTHGAYDYFLLESRDYNSAKIELENMSGNLDIYNPLEYFPTDSKTHRILSEWEMNNRNK